MAPKDGRDSGGPEDFERGRPGAAARRAPAAPEGSSGRDSRLWPVLITVGLALVFLVNGLFIYIAVKGADEVVPSYLTEER